ncbi:hypothetical protein [Pantoea dispersa]|uniref:hypothetical protein n=1 Tax=Pantoea dispersa TaxID=59814 RepID=UPI0028667F13|nr:hypothetical protein [Pantoea dispersa]MDR6297742.1 hypothetical protein [Pantoea dispersa]
MSELISAPSTVVKDVECGKVERDSIYMGRGFDTARAAAQYASQLSNEYHNLLHRHLARVDPKLAGRFSGLITELTTMTDVTYENIKHGKL